MQIFKLELNEASEQNKLDKTQTNEIPQFWLYADCIVTRSQKNGRIS